MVGHNPGNSELYFVMAGSGRPRDALTPTRLKIVRALHDGHDLSQIAATFGLTETAILEEIQPLVEAHLVQRQGDTYRPTFFVANRIETQRVVAHAETLGEAVAAQLNEDWSTIEQAFQRLRGSHPGGLADHALFLVGARILDVGLLDILARDGTLMPAAPVRPGPTSPDARYFFWMIEGAKAQLGRYGQSSTEIPWESWHLITFGAHVIDEMRNEARHKFETGALDESGHAASPEALARLLNIPAYDQADVACWTQTACSCAERLSDVYHEHEDAIRDLYGTLSASAYAPYGFGEFFCWYDHLVYAAAIDVLAAQGLLKMPEARFAAALWQGKPLGDYFLL